MALQAEQEVILQSSNQHFDLNQSWQLKTESITTIFGVSHNPEQVIFTLAGILLNLSSFMIYYEALLVFKGFQIGQDLSKNISLYYQKY